MDKIVSIGDKEIHLKYGSRTIRAIEETAAKQIGVFGLKFINARSGFGLTLNDRIPLDLLIGFLDIDFNFMMWFWGKGLDHDKAGAKPADVNDLYDTYMDEGEADDGDKLAAFKMLAIDAVNLGRGMDTGKLRTKNEKAEEDRRLKAEAEAEAARLKDLILQEKAKIQAAMEITDSSVLIGPNER